jgi:transposase
LSAQLDALRAQVDAQQAAIEQLQEQLAAARKNSSTSSKPPSSDLVKPPKPQPPPGQSQRKIGGQPGHPLHQRPLLAHELLSGEHDYWLELCPRCGLGVQALDLPPRVVQQTEIAPLPLQIVEHRGHPAWCPKCRTVHYAPLPSGVERGGMAGPRLTTLIAYLKGVCHASFSTIRKFLRDVVQLGISRGQLAKILGKVSHALDQAYHELLERLPEQARLNVDETGHKENGAQFWTWCFRAELFTLFKIDPTRSGDVLLDVLGAEFDGVLGCDYFSAYRRYHRECGVALQFCLAHLIRDVKFLTTLPDPRDRAYGERLREGLRRLFEVIHQRDASYPHLFQVLLQAARERILRWATQDVPPTRQSQNMAKRFEQYGREYFQFITTPGVEPTNNLAEQAIRFVVIDRLITQGTRSETGRRWSERIWTVIASCGQQGRSVFGFLLQTVEAAFHEAPQPSLFPSPS